MGIHVIMTNYVRGGWIRPPLLFVKLNVDASFNQDLLRGTADAVLRSVRRKTTSLGVRVPQNYHFFKSDRKLPKKRKNVTKNYQVD